VLINITVFWDRLPCQIVTIYQSTQDHIVKYLNLDITLSLI